MKTCIICRKEKENSDDFFNNEHVFPEIIGGAYKIKSVCIICNSKLGKKIDTPFSRHDTILVYRHTHNLNRGVRKIPKPFRELNKQNPDYTIEMINGQITKRLKTKKIEVADGTRYITDDIGFSEDFFNKAIKRLAKKNGVSTEDIDFSIEFSEDEETEMTVLTPNNLLIMEAAKISYELACEKIENYINDDLGKRYAKMLEVGEIDRELLIPNVLSLNDFFIKYIASNFPSKTEHQALIYFHPQIGLIATIKFFETRDELIFSFLLSENELFSTIKPFALVNDFIKQTWSIRDIE